ncbi:Uncharacterised protein [Cellulomonas fimi]|nr:Uncharacterised protein [Cellulomonas fimi]
MPAIPTAEYSSAGKTFSISRLAIIEPIVARRSPAMTTPPSNASATIVVPCGATTSAAGSGRFPGRSSGACAPRNSTNDDEPGVVKACGRRPEAPGGGVSPGIDAH